MSSKFEIKHRYSGAVLYSLETESIKLCLEAAAKSGAKLSEANLSWADLRGANLIGANLTCLSFSRVPEVKFRFWS